MIVCQPSKKDWRLFRERLPEWQENCVVRLWDKYAAILTNKDRGSEAFRAIEKRIREEEKHPGVTANATSSRAAAG